MVGDVGAGAVGADEVEALGVEEGGVEVRLDAVEGEVEGLQLVEEGLALVGEEGAVVAGELEEGLGVVLDDELEQRGDVVLVGEELADGEVAQDVAEDLLELGVGGEGLEVERLRALPRWPDERVEAVQGKGAFRCNCRDPEAMGLK